MQYQINCRHYVIQKIPRTCSSHITETCLGYCKKKKKKILLKEEDKSFAFFILKHYMLWYRKWLYYWSQCFFWLQTSIHAATWPFTLTFYSVPLSWWLGFSQCYLFIPYYLAQQFPQLGVCFLLDYWYKVCIPLWAIRLDLWCTVGAQNTLVKCINLLHQ